MQTTDNILVTYVYFLPTFCLQEEVVVVRFKLRRLDTSVCLDTSSLVAEQHNVRFLFRETVRSEQNDGYTEVSTNKPIPFFSSISPAFYRSFVQKKTSEN